MTEGTFSSKLSLASGASRRIERILPRISLRNSSMLFFCASEGVYHQLASGTFVYHVVLTVEIYRHEQAVVLFPRRTSVRPPSQGVPIILSFCPRYTISLPMAFSAEPNELLYVIPYYGHIGSAGTFHRRKISSLVYLESLYVFVLVRYPLEVDIVYVFLRLSLWPGTGLW